MCLLKDSKRGEKLYMAFFEGITKTTVIKYLLGYSLYFLISSVWPITILAIKQNHCESYIIEGDNGIVSIKSNNKVPPLLIVTWI